VRVYILLLLFFIGCATDSKNDRDYLRAPASQFHCSEIIENLFGSQNRVFEKKFLQRIRKSKQALNQVDKDYLLEKIDFYAVHLKEKSEILDLLKKKRNILNNEFLLREIEVLEESLGRAPPKSRLTSLQNGLRQNNDLTEQRKETLIDLIDYILGDISFTKIKKIGKQAPINSSYSGRKFPMEKLSVDLQEKYPNGVWFNEEGFPIFSLYATRAVEIKITGAGRFDFMRANLAAGIERVPDDMTWHHHQDGKTMLLMPRDIHDAVKHSGGVAFVTKKIKRVRGALPAGTEWAGEKYPLENLPAKLRKKYPNSVRYKINGHPDLRNYSELDIVIESTGKRQLDFRLANTKAGFEKLPPGKTWHLKEDGKTMQLVPRDLLKAIPNTPLW
tara:strand:+ start:18768 stop:19931 length:1164 start_codon:yes stop_codon:yes gene_type:complete